MMKTHFLANEERTLILNTPSLLKEDNFYINILRIPEVLSRLRQYREILSENDLDIPIWVYCITQNGKSLKEGPEISVLSLIVSLGLFDRYLAKQGWPQYFVGLNPLVSIIAGEDTFEEVVLALASGCYKSQSSLFLYKVNSYINSKTNTSYLTSLKKLHSSASLEKTMDYLGNRYEEDEIEKERIVQFLGPNEQKLKQRVEEFLDLYVHDFLEGDEGLRWLWPLWKKTQIRVSKYYYNNYGHGN